MPVPSYKTTESPKMSIFKRIRDISAAAINDMIDKAEDPVKMLNQYLRDMEDDISDAEISVAKQIAIEKKFKHQYEEAQEMVDKRGEQAVKAMESENEDLARRALQKPNMKMPSLMPTNFASSFLI
jgi:phage shock protein A